MFRCEVWARNGFCGSKSFYGAYVRQTCNASCGCTNITEPLSTCQQLAGRGADVGPFPCPTGITGTNVNGSCCVIPGAVPSTLTCASIHGFQTGPCTGTCGAGNCICTGIDCQCCVTRVNVQLTCQTIIGALPLTPTACTDSTTCAPPAGPGGQCINGACCNI